MLQSKTPVAILGATGLVGRKAIELLDHHPHFYVAETSSRTLKAPLDCESPYVISALPSHIAKSIELELAARGKMIFSNTSAHRMDPNVPILIPEVNLAHLSLLDRQETPGKIITNSNCTTAFITLALAPLLKLAPINHVSAITMQALSGAGNAGPSALSALGNIIPHIPDEETKIVRETRKILSQPKLNMLVHVHRVPVIDGHTIALHIHFDSPIDLDEVKANYSNDPYVLYEQEDRPQPRFDIAPNDMRVHIGRLKLSPDSHTLGLIAMGHNLVRGAAGAAIKNMETLHMEMPV